MSDVTRAVESPERLAALRSADLLDTPPEEAFDQLTRLAARLLSAPIALVSLVDKDRQFFKSCIGPLSEPWLSQRQSPLSHSLCQYAVASGEPLIIEDAREHPVVKDNLAVTQSGVVAYAGIPLITPDGHALGTLCVFDSKPRHWTQEQIENLLSLASSVVSTIAYRAAARASQPASSDRADASTPDKEDTAPLVQAGNVLAEAVEEYLRKLNGLDECMQDPKRRGQEAECQSALLDAEKQMKQATEEFQRRLEELGGKPETSDFQPALELWQACVTYFAAERRRSEVMERFKELRVALSEVEREAILALNAEQAIRLASRTYELTRE